VSRKNLEIIAELIREQHNTDITAQDLAEIQEFLWLRSQTTIEPLSKPGDLGHLNTVEVDLRYDVVKVLGFVAGAVLGALFLPALGLGIGLFSGALIGGAIGYRLAGLFDNGNAAAAPTKTADLTLYQFSGVGGLLVLGTPIPKIYGNRSNNPDGGVYLNDPGQLYTRVTSSRGSRFLDQVFLLGTGRLGEVNLQGLQLDDKPLSDWEVGDVVVAASNGFHNQEPVSSNVRGHSQAIALSTNNYIGLAPAVKIGVPDPSLDVLSQLSSNNISSFNNGDFIKNTGVGDGWNAQYITNNFTLPGGYGSYCKISGSFRPPNTNPIRASIGFSNTATPGANPTNWFIRLEIDGSNWRYWANGINVESGTWAPVPGQDIFAEVRSYRSHPAGYIQIFLNNFEIVRRINHLSADIDSVWGVWSLHTARLTVIDPRHSSMFIYNNDIMPGIGMRFRVNEDSVGKLRSGQVYRSEYGSSDISIIAKDVVARWVEFNTDVWISDINSGTVVATPIVIIGQISGTPTALLSAYRASVTTTKRVTGVELLIEANISARNANNDLVPHSQAFRVVVIDKANVNYEASRFILISTDEKPFIRSIIIENLPLDIYTFKILPLSGKEIPTPILSLEDAELRAVISPPALIVGGQQGTVIVEPGAMVSAADAVAKLSFDGKSRTSSDSGPAMRITHINELISAPTPLTYSGYTIGATRSIASDRLQSAATQAWDIPKGSIVRQYLAYGTTLINSNPHRITVAENALLPGLLVAGDTVRLLGYGNRIITQVIDLHTVECAPYICPITTVAGSPVIVVSEDNYSAILVGMPISLASGIPADAVVIAKLANNSLLLGDEWERRRVATQSNFVTATFNAALPQTTKEEAVFFSIGSSNYFPDLYVDRLINPIDGLGNRVNQDYFIHYPSIVYCRKYCVKNKFFYDGVFSEGIFEAWAIASAPSSLLYCTEINGQFALVAQEGSPKNPFIFNDSNTSKYVEPGVEDDGINTVLIEYQDNKGKKKQLKLQTTEANTGIEEEISRSPIILQGVTSRQQAITVGINALKSIRLQNYTNQFDTDIEKGLYCLQGDIVRTQHTATEHQTQNNGFVLSAEPTTNQQLTTIRSITIKAITSGYLVVDEPHRLHPTATDTLAITGNNVAANNNQYASGSWLYVDPTSLILTPAQGTPGTGGTLAIRRNTYDQIITLSEAITLTPQHRISIAHKDRATEENKVITALGDGRYRVSGVEQTIAPGDAWILSTVGIKEKYWRITSMKPDLKTNTVSLTGVLWDDGVLSADGVVVVG
jgi:hypothetical protein